MAQRRHGAFDLVGRGCRAPQEVLRETHSSFLSVPYYTATGIYTGWNFGGRVVAEAEVIAPVHYPGEERHQNRPYAFSPSGCRRSRQ